MTSPRERNLTGVWTGLYTYPDGASVTFTASLLHSGEHLSGGIHEPDTVTSSGGMLHASLVGRADAASVTFRKRYEAMPEWVTDAVDYQGTLSADGDEIEGRWRIPWLWVSAGGSFLMVRDRGVALPAAEEAAADA